MEPLRRRRRDTGHGDFKPAQLAVNDAGRTIRFGARVVSSDRDRLTERSLVGDAQHRGRDRADQASGADHEACGIKGRLEKSRTLQVHLE